MTLPVVSQVANHLAKTGGKFTGTELVTIMAGGNDVLMQLGGLSAGATAAGTAAGQKAFPTLLIGGLVATVPAANQATAQASIGLGRTNLGCRQAATRPRSPPPPCTAAAQLGANVQAAQAAAAKAGTDAQAAGAKAGADYAAAQGPVLVAALGKAGAELAAIVKTQLVAKGANYVVVNNLPDVASTPSGKAQSAETQTLIKRDGRHLQRTAEGRPGRRPAHRLRRPVLGQPRPGDQPGHLRLDQHLAKGLHAPNRRSPAPRARCRRRTSATTCSPMTSTRPHTSTGWSRVMS